MVERNAEPKTVKTSLTPPQFTDLLFEHASQPLLAPVLVDGKGERFALTPTQGSYDPSFSLEQASLGERGLWLHKITKMTGAMNLPELGSPGTQVQWQGGEAGFWAWASKEGFYPIDLSVDSIVMGSPADKAKLQKDDVVTGINGTKIKSFEELRALVQKNPVGQEVNIQFMRQGKQMTVKLLPESREVDKKKIMTIGVYIGHMMVLPRMIETKPSGMGNAIGLAWARTVDGVKKTVGGYKKLITKEVGLNNIGGPLAIGKVASDSFHISLSMFFRLMAIISINLGVINLFPIPVLDGGHILFLGFELVNRGPLSRRKLELAQRFGVSFLFLLIFIALFNDISRLIS